jgi:hypothetical protein
MYETAARAASAAEKSALQLDDSWSFRERPEARTVEQRTTAHGAPASLGPQALPCLVGPS